MSWAVGYDSDWERDVGYGVPAICDYPSCGKNIDRGLSYVCGGEPFGGANGCGLYFCLSHLDHREVAHYDCAVCERCLHDNPPFEPTPDVKPWLRHKLTDPTWERWRDANPAQVEAAREHLSSDPI